MASTLVSTENDMTIENKTLKNNGTRSKEKININATQSWTLHKKSNTRESGPVG